MTGSIVNRKKSFFSIVYSFGQHSGYGHYKRSQIIETYLKNKTASKVNKIRISDSEITRNNISETILKKINKKKIKILILDLNYSYVKSTFKIKKLLTTLNDRGIKTVGIDSLRHFSKYLDCVWIPSPFKKKNLISKKIVWGWDKMVFNRYKLTHHKKKNIFFLLGGAKNTLLNKHLPKLVEKKIPKEFNLYWVCGKFSDKPKFFDKTRWTLCKNSNSLEKKIPKSSFVFSLYGLSFFEALSCGIPSVAFCANSNYKKDYNEIEFLKKNKIYFIEKNLSKSVDALVNLINSKNLHKKFLKNSKKHLRFFDYSFLKKI